jgi:hypothetical protein
MQFYTFDWTEKWGSLQYYGKIRREVSWQHFGYSQNVINFFLILIFSNMGNLLYLIAVILIIIWAISFFGGYYTGGIIHILLVIAIIVILLRVIRGGSV